MTTDKAKAPVESDGPVREADLDPGANSAFMTEMLGDRGGYSMDQAAEFFAGSDLLDAFIKGDDEADNQGQAGRESEDRAPQRSDDGQSDELPADESDDLETDEGGQGDDAPGEESEGDGNAVLLTRGADGKLVELGLEDIEVPFELDGEQQQMSLAEIQQELRDNRLRRDDYTRKTMEVGQRVSEEVRRQTAERQAQLDEGLNRLKVVFEAFGDHLGKDVSFDELKKHYGGNADHAGHAFSRIQKFNRALEETRQGMEQRATETRNANIETTLQALRSEVPEFRDEKAFTAELRGMREFFLAEGLTGDQVALVFQDPAYAKLARKAYLGDKLLRQAKQPVRRGKTTVRLGQAKAPNAKAAANRRVQAQRKQRVRPDPFAALNTGGVKVGYSESEALDLIVGSLGGK